MRIFLAIPSYRCANQLRRVLQTICAEKQLCSLVGRVIVFDNQSPDDTIEVAHSTVNELAASDWIQIARNNENYGLGGTHKLCFDWARREKFDYVVILHGDDQADGAEILRLIEFMKQGYDAILGARFMPGSRRLGYSKLRTLGNMGLNFVYSILTGRLLWDLGSGLNAFKVSAIDFAALPAFSNGFTFNMDILLNLISNKRRLKFVPITWREFDQRSNASTFGVGWRVLKTILLWRFGFSGGEKSMPVAGYGFSFDKEALGGKL